MIDKDIYDKIASLADESTEDTFLALSEEVGELALALHVRNGTKFRDLKEPAESEAVDVLLCGIEMLVKLGIGVDEINKIAQAKLEKWEKSVEARRAKTTSSSKELGRIKIGKQDRWLIDQGYIQREYWKFIDFPMELTGEIVIYSGELPPLKDFL